MIPTCGRRVNPIDPDHQDDVYEMSAYHELLSADDFYDLVQDQYPDDI